MKKFSILALTLMLAFGFAACSSNQVATDAKADVKKVEPKVDPKVVCKADCDKTAAACLTAAGKAKAKIAACDKAKVACAADCDKAKVAEPAKKVEPAKKK